MGNSIAELQRVVVPGEVQIGQLCFDNLRTDTGRSFVAEFQTEANGCTSWMSTSIRLSPGTPPGFNSALMRAINGFVRKSCSPSFSLLKLSGCPAALRTSFRSYHDRNQKFPFT